MKWQTIITDGTDAKYFEHFHASVRLHRHEIKKDRYGTRYVACKKCKTRWLFIASNNP